MIWQAPDDLHEPFVPPAQPPPPADLPNNQEVHLVVLYMLVEQPGQPVQSDGLSFVGTKGVINFLPYPWYCHSFVM